MHVAIIMTNQLKLPILKTSKKILKLQQSVFNCLSSLKFEACNHGLQRLGRKRERKRERMRRK